MKFAAALLLSSVLVVVTSTSEESISKGSYIIAPFETQTKGSSYELRTIGPAGYVCAKMNLTEPEPGYNMLYGYLDKGNEKKEDYLNVTAWPIVESRQQAQNKSDEVCIYLPKKDHCYPPKPVENQVFTVNEHYKKVYYGFDFWGQASDARVAYESNKLKTAIKQAAVTNADLSVAYLSYWPDHRREIRYDKTVSAVQ